ncbi:hypothetical protein ACNF42_08380, partial [Cuniculiplasma sp. SKW3]|uniref:hypothetical protein n=1 Tax=Cuniculiplasma sp. SKW3 TaxID=3400170 RepID=UPI003FD0BE88
MTPVKGMNKERKKFIFPILAAAIVIASSFFIIYHYDISDHHATEGLPVQIRVILKDIPHFDSTYTTYPDSGFTYNLSNASLTLLAFDPEWITTGGNFGSKNITYNLSDNPYVVDVFNGRSDSYGMIT